MGEPLFTLQKEKDDKVEVWAMLIEKAISKLMKSYYNSRLLSTKDVLYILTGCPVYSLDLLNFNHHTDLFQIIDNNLKSNYILSL